MSSLVRELLKFNDKLLSADVLPEKKYKILIAINELDLTIEDLMATKLARTVKKCSKLPGKPGVTAQLIVNKWKAMFQTPDKQNNADKIHNNNNYKDSYKEKKSHITKEDTDSNHKSNYNERLEGTNTKVHRSRYESKSPNNYSDEDYHSKDIKSEKNLSSNYKENSTYKSENSSDVYRKSKDYHNSDLNGNAANKYDNLKIKSEEYMNMKSERSIDKNQKSQATNVADYKQKSKTEIPNLEKPKQDILKPKTRKIDVNPASSFEDFLKDGASQTESSGNKRKSMQFSSYGETNSKKVKMEKKSDREFNILSKDLPDLPDLSSSLSDDDINEEMIKKRLEFKDNGTKADPEIEEDIDCTTKYSSERKVWVPSRKIDTTEPLSSPEETRMINGVSETVIAQYDYQKLLEFENDNRKIMKQTERFWERLYNKEYKSQPRRENEKYRDSYLRVHKYLEKKMKDLSARIKRNNDEKNQAVNKAKLLNCTPGKFNRRITDMRR